MKVGDGEGAGGRRRAMVACEKGRASVVGWSGVGVEWWVGEEARARASDEGGVGVLRESVEVWWRWCGSVVPWRVVVVPLIGAEALITLCE